MKSFSVSATRTINLEKVRGYEKIESGTRIYIPFGFGIDFVDCSIPYEMFGDIMRSKETVPEPQTNNQMARDIRQLALYQAIPTP